MITTRRSFVKFISAALGSVPLPGVLERFVEVVKPDEQTLEDAEDILRGLIARCVNGPIDGRDASLITSFVKRTRPSSASAVAYAKRVAGLPGDRLDLADAPYPIRFICGVMQGIKSKPWVSNNFKQLSSEALPEILSAFYRPGCKEIWFRDFDRERRSGGSDPKRNRA